MEIENLHKNIFIPEPFRNGTVVLQDLSILSKNQIEYEFPFGTEVRERFSDKINDDAKFLKFSILNLDNKFSGKIMLELINLFIEKDFALLYWDSVCELFYFYFFIPNVMNRFKNAVEIIEEIGLKCKVIVQ